MTATAEEKPTSQLMKQISDQCRVVAHLGRALADVYDDYATLFADGGEGPEDIANLVGQRTASLMETLGDILNGIDAVTEEDEWTLPIFREANRLWLGPIFRDAARLVTDRTQDDQTKNVRQEVSEKRQLVSEHRDLLVALKSLCDVDASYHGNEIRIPCESHGEAIGRLRNARDVIAKVIGTFHPSDIAGG